MTNKNDEMSLKDQLEYIEKQLVLCESEENAALASFQESIKETVPKISDSQTLRMHAIACLNSHAYSCLKLSSALAQYNQFNQMKTSLIYQMDKEKPSIEKEFAQKTAWAIMSSHAFEQQYMDSGDMAVMIEDALKSYGISLLIKNNGGAK